MQYILDNIRQALEHLVSVRLIRSGLGQVIRPGLGRDLAWGQVIRPGLGRDLTLGRDLAWGQVIRPGLGRDLTLGRDLAHFPEIVSTLFFER